MYITRLDPELRPLRPRLVEPELRSRVVGYLAAAPSVAVGYRGDGDWVWPEALADEARWRGVGPPEPLLAHLTDRGYEPPESLPTSALPASLRLQRDVLQFIADREGEVLYRVQADGETRRFTPYGWTKGLENGELVFVSDDEASVMMDRLCARWYQWFLARHAESDALTRPRLARVFDGERPSGGPWFSPRRRRIVEPTRRARIATYLSTGRLVVRTTARAEDPLRTDSGPVVPLNWRTDGVWVWQEALAYYMVTAGIAPELALLCHIEEHGRPADVSDEVAHRAAHLVRGPAPSLGPQVQVSYWRGAEGALARQWPSGLRAGPPRQVDGPGDSTAERLGEDLRWSTPTDLRDFHEISESDAVEALDRGWLAATADQRA
jgi:hypothetical protein